MKTILALFTFAVFTLSSSMALASSYDTFTKDIMEPYGFYKKSLALTSKKKNKAKAITVVSKYINSWNKFASQYAANAPEPFRTQDDFGEKITRPVSVGENALKMLQSGEVKKAHIALEEVRYLLWNIRVQAGLSSLNDKINDFHEAMEIVLDGIKDKNTAEELQYIGNRYGAWLAIKWEEVARSKIDTGNKTTFEDAAAKGREAIITLRKELANGNVEAARKAGSNVKKQYKAVFFLPECS